MGWLQDELKRWTRIAEATKVLPGPETELECEPLKMKVQLIKKEYETLNVITENGNN